MMDIEARLKAASPTERNQAIRDARQAGWTIRRIATTVGMSVGGIHKILNSNTEIIQRIVFRDGQVADLREGDEVTTTFRGGPGGSGKKIINKEQS